MQTKTLFATKRSGLLIVVNTFVSSMIKLQQNTVSTIPWRNEVERFNRIKSIQIPRQLSGCATLQQQQISTTNFNDDINPQLHIVLYFTMPKEMLRRVFSTFSKILALSWMCEGAFIYLWCNQADMNLHSASAQKVKSSMIFMFIVLREHW